MNPSDAPAAGSVRRTRALFDIAWRESRTARRRLLLYMSSISLGVAALVAIDSFSDNVTRSVHEQSRALTGGDIAITSRRPFGERTKALLDSFSKGSIGVASQTTFPSMAFVPRTGGTRLVQIRAVTDSFPFFGEITSKPVPAWRELHRGANAVVDAGLLVSLNAQVGDTVAIGTSRFQITGTLEQVPGELGITAAIGPRVYIPESQLASTGLLVFGSRAQYETVLRLPSDWPPRRFMGRFGARLRGDSVRVRTAGYNESQLADAIGDLTGFLAIVGLVALLLGGVGVASGVHAFVIRKIDTVAVLRCLGATSSQVLLIYVAQAAAMGFVGAAIGAVLGIAVQFALPSAIKDFLPLNVSVTLEPAAIAWGLGVGVWVSLVFALRPLVALRLVSPLQALRRDTDADVSKRVRRDSMTMVVTIAIVASVVALAMARAETVERGLSYSGAIAAAIAALWISAVLLSRLARALARPGVPFPIRQGIAALYRPGNQTRAVVLALGFGGFLIGTVYQVQQNLLSGLDFRLEQARGNVVFFDVQEDQRPGLDSIIRGAGYPIVDQTPIIRMRIDSINGESVSPSAPTARPPIGAGANATGRNAGAAIQPAPITAGSRGRRSSWATRREYNSTYRDSLTAAELIVAGKWFDPVVRPGELPEVSIESDVASELRLSLGDTVTWNVQGVRVSTRVTSFREVKWASFQPNFFAIFESEALRDAPKQFVVLANLPGPAEMALLQRDVVSKYPTISSIDLTLVQRTIGDVVGKVTMAVRFLALLSLGLSIPVLFSAVSATRRQRLREGVLLKTLGATRRQIGRIMLAEYALLGALGATSGLLLSTIASWALIKWVFDSTFTPVVPPMLLIAGGMIGLAVAIGLLTGREVFRSTAMAALRET